MTPERALEIIAAYGADSARWPDADRAAVLALAAADAGVASALRDAAGLDALLAGWAHDVAPHGFKVAAITAMAQERPARARRIGWPWIGGGALAAAVAAGLVIYAPVRPAAETEIATLAPPVAAPSASADAEAFDTIFTPTPDEEQLI